MLSEIRDEEEKKLWISQLQRVVGTLAKQDSLPKEAQISGSMLAKLEKLRDFLEKQIWLYEQIERI